MDGEKRREIIVELLKTNEEPISGTAFAVRLGVSRQIIVQDIALLRATNKNILSTNKGYIIYGTQEGGASYKRVLAVKHTDAEIQDELYTIVDEGAKVLDVIVEHEIYGQISVDLSMKSRKDVEEFVEKITSNVAKPLKELTNDVHYHTIEAEREAILDEIEKKLREKQYLIS